MPELTAPPTIAQRLANPETLLRSLPRTVELDHAQARASADGKTIRFEGHAARFDSPSETLHDMWGPFREILKPGCFADAVAANADGREDTKFLGLNHDPSTILARYGNGTLELEEDAEGLLVRADLAPTARALELATLLERRDIHQMSFKFTVAKEGETWTWDETGDLREITAVARLYDVCPVTWPAYTDTDAGLRELEHLRSMGLDIQAGRRSADPRSLASIGRALGVLDDLPDELVTRARAAAHRPTVRASEPTTTEPPKEISDDERDSLLLRIERNEHRLAQGISAD